MNQQPPQNLEAERDVIGCAMIDPDCIAELAALLPLAAFYSEPHAIVFKAIVELKKQDAAPDLTVLSNHLEALGLLEKIGGTSYLAECAAGVPTPKNFRHYAKIVWDKYLLREARRAHRIGDQYISDNQESELPPEEIIAASAKTLNDLCGPSPFAASRTIKQVAGDLIRQIDACSKGGLPGLSTGFRLLDETIYGLQPGDLIIVAAETSVGKTSLALQIGDNVEAAGNPVDVMSLEMSDTALLTRVIAQRYSIPSKNIATGNLTSSEWQLIKSSFKSILNSKWNINDNPGNTNSRLEASIRSAILAHGSKLIIVDYIQLIAPWQGQSKHDVRGDTVRMLKNLAMEFKIPVIAISQLSRPTEQGKRPQQPRLHRLKESGDIENSASKVIFIYRPGIWTQDKSATEIIVAKHQNGPTKIIHAVFEEAFSRFFEAKTQYSNEEDTDE